MKKLSISLLVMLLIASLFTSCSMGSDDASDVRVKVKITPSGGGRSLTTDFETINLDDDNITWYYSATKVSETQFNYGATSDSLLPKDGIVTLSQGDWSIGLWGIKDGKKVYAGTTSKVTIKWNFYEPNVTVPVPVKQSTGDNGYIVLTDVKIPVNEELKTPNFASIDSTIIMNFNGVNMRLECIPGPHTVTFEYRSDNGDVKSSMSLVVEVISGRETTISGNIDPSKITSGSSSLTKVEQAIEVKKEGDTVVNVLVAPANTSSNLNQTTVTFPQGALPEEATTAVLNLSVKSAGDFSVANTPAVAGIDISLKVNEQEVTSFNNEYVVITTYILAGLEDVQVKYTGEGDQPILVSYNRETGELVFKTNHFSEYIVVANVEALNVSTGIPYTKLVTAIAEVDDEQIVKLLSNVSVNSISIPNKNFTIDLNSKTIETQYGLYLNKSDSEYVLSVKNGTIKSSIGHTFSMYQSSGLIIDNMNVEAAYGGVYLSETNNNMSVRVINGSKIKAAVYGIATNASKEESEALYIEVKDSIVETSSEDQDNTGILFNVQGKVYIENSTIKGNRQGMILRGGTNSVIKNSTIEATGTKTSGYDWTDNMTNDWGQGNQVPLASLVVGNHVSNNSYPYPVSVKLENATIKFSENRSGIYIYKTTNYDVSVNGTIAEDTTINSIMNGATCSIVGNIAFAVSSDDEFSAALNNASDKIIIHLPEGEFTLPDAKCENKNVKMVGSGDGTKLNILNNKDEIAYPKNATLEFEKMTIQGQKKGNYGGLAHTNKVTYKDCKMLGKITLYAGVEEFNNCIFENKNDYAIWTWGGREVTLTGCTFNSGGKAVLLYGGAGSSETPTTVLTVTDCVFNDDNTLNTEKAAIETGNDYNATYILNVTNTTVDGFAINPEGISTGTTLWANKNSMVADHLFVTVDGVKVYGK
ncbi:hypothetical protein FYJ80_06880 [Spirochaetales bacterium NM-380-WT-3C1]|uniref:Right handed beta helix domain-containing protein n=1 Tax=Bullifex porci TaxID=2606638 RepID=A0A7X2PCQ0_9SPIO|nr:hypothetical protein [Bullifex porci]MSU06506.1 hypothetical protein [Bullifex porci]